MLNSEKEYALYSMNEGVLIFSPKGEALYINPYAEQILGTGKETKNYLQAIQKKPDQKTNELIDLIAECIDNGGMKESRVIYYYGDNDVLHTLYASCTKTEGGNYVLTFSNLSRLAENYQKRMESKTILTSFFVIGCLWTIGVAVWMETGKVFPVGYLTIIMECLALITIGILLRLTSLKLMDLGLSFQNIGPTMKRTLIRIPALLIFFCLVKIIVRFFQPSAFSPEAPFWDWSQADYRLITYIQTAFVQEFLARGGVQTSLTRAYDGKYAKDFAIFVTSLYFASLHFQYGSLMMLGAGLLSILLGYFYKEDENIYGVAIFHYCFGKFADFLNLI